MQYAHKKRWLLSYILFSKVKSQTRCTIKRDQGLTRANTTGIRYCCLFFARGCCPYGWECEYLHMLPDASWSLPDASKDCFARDKFVDYRDDMGGVGSFSRQNRTLYVGRIKETGPGPETEEIVIRHFKEWGEIEKSTLFCSDLGFQLPDFFSLQSVFFNIEALHS